MKKIVYIRPGDIYVTPAFSRVIESKKLLDDPSLSIIVLQWLDAEQSKEEAGICYYNFRTKRGLLGLIGWNIFILRYLILKAPGYVHNFSFHSWFPILLYKFLYPKKIRLFYDCRDYFGWSFSLAPFTKRASIWIDRRISRICEQIIFPDSNGFVYFNCRDKNFTAIPNTVTDFLGDKTIARIDSEKTIRLFYAGYLSKDRNIDTIIEAVKKYDYLELHIASNFISNQFDKDLLDDPRFVFHGKLSHKTVIDLMLKCDYCLIMYNAKLKNYQLIQPTKFYDCLMSNTPYICAEGMEALQANCGGNWPNLCLAYGDITVFKDLKKPLKNNMNRALYESKYRYEIVLQSIAHVYTKYLTA